MKFSLILLMSAAVILSRGSSFTVVTSGIRRSSTSRLYANTLLTDFRSTLERSFSSMTGNDSAYYTVAITGSTGLVGSALIDELSKEGKLVNGKPAKVVKLVRGNPSSSSSADKSDDTSTTLTWDPTSSTTALDPASLRDIDAVIHLAGENIATGMGPLGFLGIRPWSDEKKDEIMNSRAGPSAALAKAVADCDTPTVFLGASGVGVYGNDYIGSGCAVADETMDVSQTKGFLADVSRAWEEAENMAKTNKSRVVNLRFGVVMSKLGGTLAKLYPIFFLGGGGNVGSGQQYFSFVSARDAARAVVHVLETKALSGPVNVCAPEPCTNEEFTASLGQTMSRPTILPLPGFAVKALFGEMGEELLLGGNRVYPKKLLDSGFEFQHPDIASSLQSAINQENI